MRAPAQLSKRVRTGHGDCSGRSKSRFSNRGLIAALLAASLLVGAACDRNVEPYQPGEQSRPPDLARIFPGPPGGIGSAEVANEDDGQTTRAAMPPTRAEAGGPAPAVSRLAAGAGGPIQGRIEIAPELAKAAPGGGVLFVIARPQGARGGPPLAVLRISSPSFPLDFSIGPENVMIPSMRFEGAISLSARLDADGNAMTRGGTDLSSAVEEPLEPGATDVRLVLSEKG